MRAAGLGLWFLLVACGPSAPRPVAAPPPASPATDDVATDDVATGDDPPFADEASRALAERACAGYDRCQELGVAWREGRAPDDAAGDEATISAACMDKAAGLSPDELDALRACLDQACHGGCDCIDWVARWGSMELECNYGDNPSDFVEPGD